LKVEKEEAFYRSSKNKKICWISLQSMGFLNNAIVYHFSFHVDVKNSCPQVIELGL